MEMMVEGLAREARRELDGAYGAGEAAAMVRLMFHALKGWDQTQLIMHGDTPASDYLCTRIREMVKRVKEGEPVQYVTGEAYFYGMNLTVRKGVLIPRPETAELVDLIVKENPDSDLKVLDVGCGSGAIAIALARNLRFADVTAIDISPVAVEVSRENAERLKARINIMQADIFTWQPEEDCYDLIVSNPPYIAESEKKDMERNVLAYEPAQALFVTDENPLVYYSRIAEVGMQGLKRGGRLYFEINPRYGEDLRSMLMKEGYEEIEILKDSYGRVRFVKCLK